MKDIQQTAKPLQNQGCIYLQFEDSNEKIDPVDSIWATLLYQMLMVQYKTSFKFSKELKERFYDTIHNPVPLNSSEILNLFQAQVKMLSTVYIILDGLDLLIPQHSPSVRQVLCTLRALPQNVHVLWTARDEKFGQLSEQDRIRVVPREMDVRSYVQWRLQEAIREAQENGHDSPLSDTDIQDEVQQKVSRSTLDTGV